MRRTPLSLSALLLAAACSTDLGPTESTEANLATTNAATTVIANGNAITPLGAARRIVKFTVSRSASGVVTGTYRVDRTDSGAWFRVGVTCASVVGDTLWVGGLIKETNTPAIVKGSVSYFFAVDNGSGSGAPKDEISTTRINDAAGQDQAFCTDRPALLPKQALLDGFVNVQ